MNVHMCGLWDATNLWLQWDDVAPEQGYRVRVRFRAPGQTGEVDWRPWLSIQSGLPYRRAWIVIPTWKQGWQCRAEVSVAPDGEWVPATEVTFLRSRCLFSIETSRRPVRYLAGAEFHAVVDAAACHYQIPEEISLAPGERIEVEMTASLATGYCQLDYPGHFETSPALGLLIRNLAPSVDDVRETGHDFTQLAALPQTAPLKVVLGGRNMFAGNA